MGYVFELRAGELDAVRAALLTPDPKLETRASAGLVAEVAQAMSGHLAVTATSDVAVYLCDVVAANSHWWGAVQHSSSGGPDFRGEYLEEIAPLFGRDFAMLLMSRPLFGIHTVDHPLIGWVKAEEVERALARAATHTMAATEEQSEVLQTLLPVLERASHFQLDLFGLYL